MELTMDFVFGSNCCFNVRFIGDKYLLLNNFISDQTKEINSTGSISLNGLEFNPNTFLSLNH